MIRKGMMLRNSSIAAFANLGKPKYQIACTIHRSFPHMVGGGQDSQGGVEDGEEAVDEEHVCTEELIRMKGSSRKMKQRGPSSVSAASSVSSSLASNGANATSLSALLARVGVPVRPRITSKRQGAIAGAMPRPRQHPRSRPRRRPRPPHLCCNHVSVQPFMAPALYGELRPRGRRGGWGRPPMAQAGSAGR